MRCGCWRQAPDNGLLGTCDGGCDGACDGGACADHLHVSSPAAPAVLGSVQPTAEACVLISPPAPEPLRGPVLTLAMAGPP